VSGFDWVGIIPVGEIDDFRTGSPVMARTNREMTGEGGNANFTHVSHFVMAWLDRAMAM
jgi:hypothetical protein